ncbi:hypothetical protein AB1283_19645 [Bacillus sp. S13(2024)]|uniref:hypothetical protein n=1 Tax=unclassified Bacillus (in: firmicutes) TaxID=185979 RepID=UPI003D2436A1
MKKMFIPISMMISLFVLLTVSIFYNDLKQNYDVIWAQHSDHEIKQYAMKCLQKNKISYQIDNDSNVKIMKKDVNKAVMSCT